MSVPAKSGLPKSSAMPFSVPRGLPRTCATVQIGGRYASSVGGWPVAWNMSPPCGVVVMPATTLGMAGAVAWLGTGAGMAC